MLRYSGNFSCKDRHRKVFGAYSIGGRKEWEKAEKGASVPVCPESGGGHDRAVCDPHAFAG